MITVGVDLAAEAARTARAVALGLTTVPAPGQAEAARTEGWIALPDAPLAALRPDAPERRVTRRG